MTDDLDALLEGYEKAYMQYPEPRRAIESKFMRALVAEIKALKMARFIDGAEGIAEAHVAKFAEEMKRKPGRPPKKEAA